MSGPLCGEGDFDGADDLGDVVGVDGGGGGGVEAREEAVQVSGAAGWLRVCGGVRAGRVFEEVRGRGRR